MPGWRGLAGAGHWHWPSPPRPPLGPRPPPGPELKPSNTRPPTHTLGPLGRSARCEEWGVRAGGEQPGECVGGGV